MKSLTTFGCADNWRSFKLRSVPPGGKQFLLKMASFTVAVSLLSGCASTTGYPTQSGNVNTELQELNIYYAPDVLQTYHTFATEGDKIGYRNEVVNGRLRAIDIHYFMFVKALTGESNTAGVATDWAVLALSGAGVTAPTAATKTIFAAISSGIVGAKGSLDKNLLYQKALPALISQMDALRSTELAKIRASLQLPAQDYPLTEALIDTDDYYQAGTLPGAISGITITSGSTSAMASQDIAAVLAKRVDAAPLSSSDVGPALAQITDDQRALLIEINGLNLTPSQAALVIKNFNGQIVTPNADALTKLKSLVLKQDTDLPTLKKSFTPPLK